MQKKQDTILIQSGCIPSVSWPGSYIHVLFYFQLLQARIGRTRRQQKLQQIGRWWVDLLWITSCANSHNIVLKVSGQDMSITMALAFHIKICSFSSDVLDRSTLQGKNMSWNSCSLLGLPLLFPHRASFCFFSTTALSCGLRKLDQAHGCRNRKQQGSMSCKMWQVGSRIRNPETSRFLASNFEWFRFSWGWSRTLYHLASLAGRMPSTSLVQEAFPRSKSYRTGADRWVCWARRWMPLGPHSSDSMLPQGVYLSGEHRIHRIHRIK